MQLVLPLGKDYSAVWQSCEEECFPVLRKMGEMLLLPIIDNDEITSGDYCLTKLFSADKGIVKESLVIGGARFRCRIDDERKCISTWLVNWNLLGLKEQIFQCRMMLFCGLIPACITGNIAMVHGGLAKKGERCVICCGPSGIGKSTTMRRLSNEWEILADDCFIVREENNAVVAQPLTTWTFWTDGKGGTGFADSSRTVKLTEGYLLERGEKNTFLSLSDMEYQLGLSASLTDMVFWHSFSLPSGLKKRLFNNALLYADLLIDKLPWRRWCLALNDKLHL